MNREYSPIDLGLDAMGIQATQNPVIALDLEGKSTEEVVSLVNGHMEHAMLRYPEMKSEILVAGMHILLNLADSVESVWASIVPGLDRVVDRVAV